MPLINVLQLINYLCKQEQLLYEWLDKAYARVEEMVPLLAANPLKLLSTFQQFLHEVDPNMAMITHSCRHVFHRELAAMFNTLTRHNCKDYERAKLEGEFDTELASQALLSQHDDDDDDDYDVTMSTRWGEETIKLLPWPVSCRSGRQMTQYICATAYPHYYPTFEHIRSRLCQREDYDADGGVDHDAPKQNYHYPQCIEGRRRREQREGRSKRRRSGSRSRKATEVVELLKNAYVKDRLGM